jgi:hypothetical protein
MKARTEEQQRQLAALHQKNLQLKNPIQTISQSNAYPTSRASFPPPAFASQQPHITLPPPPLTSTHGVHSQLLSSLQPSSTSLPQGQGNAQVQPQAQAQAQAHGYGQVQGRVQGTMGLGQASGQGQGLAPHLNRMPHNETSAAEEHVRQILHQKLQAKATGGPNVRTPTPVQVRML